jgi:hypothetical protein
MGPEQTANRVVQAVGAGLAIAVAVVSVVLLVPLIVGTWGPVVGLIAAAAALSVGVEEFVRWRRRHV